ncbi:MAG: hypothetical protein HN390_08410 [Anaerolineae bacterium]|jgi:hypothetical protein|nr:hypothetical protein [Anaerolineae bacterium]MBT7189402.1 hypothetical protein [Anaerolineae bacterium]MBT7991989.1 hypothetical protein [Anaerolineae bacterium]
MDTSDYISLFAVFVSIIAGFLNYFYLRKQLRLLTNPKIDIEFSFDKNRNPNKPIYASSPEHGSYRYLFNSTLKTKIKNLSNDTSITDLKLVLEIQNPNRNWLLNLLIPSYYFTSAPIPTNKKIGRNLDPLEEQKYNLTYVWDMGVASLFPDNIKLVINKTEDDQTGYYAVKKQGPFSVHFSMKATISYRAGVANAEEIVESLTYSLGAFSSRSGGLSWSIKKTKKPKLFNKRW